MKKSSTGWPGELCAVQWSSGRLVPTGCQKVVVSYDNGGVSARERAHPCTGEPVGS